MKIEVRCPGCDKAYLVDPRKLPEAGAVQLCQACGTPIELRVPERSAAARPATSGTAPPPTAVTSERRPVVCPRCGLHFTPDEAAAPAPRSTRPRVLLVEDMEFFQEIARQALEATADVVQARTLAEARRALAAGGIDLLLLDLSLEGEDGRDLLRGLRSKPCPILIFTARDEADMYGETWQELQRFGADDVVVKGMQMGDVLARKVAALLGPSA